MAIRVLIVDDEPTICRLLAEMLKQFEGYQVMTEADGRRVLPLLQQEAFDVVLLDLIMPNPDGMTLLREVKKRHPELPVIVVTGYGSIETAVAAMQAGAADFMTKPVQASVLDIRIKKALEHVHAWRLAHTDGLTGLFNRRALQERLQQEVERANRYRRPLSLVMIDIDFFKHYNDTHGHLQGDTVLVEVALLLRQRSRAADFVARYGGEEFAIILPETACPNAVRFGERLRAAVARRRFPGEDCLPGGRLTISVGVASHRPLGTREALLQAADAALYQAKRQGRNRVCLAP
ncbi:MAG: diguanylate cyclase response regulator [Candidatus Tectimicrobiota bacterium]|nr:MAG: diguanylate cyclase response regulator [Candidatus Tectomicrobia bacterium]